jgi:hypothetical protein
VSRDDVGVGVGRTYEEVAVTVAVRLDVIEEMMLEVMVSEAVEEEVVVVKESVEVDSLMVHMYSRKQPVQKGSKMRTESAYVFDRRCEHAHNTDAANEVGKSDCG